jgi:hypothetical protein
VPGESHHAHPGDHEGPRRGCAVSWWRGPISAARRRRGRPGGTRRRCRRAGRASLARRAGCPGSVRPQHVIAGKAPGQAAADLPAGGDVVIVRMLHRLQDSPASGLQCPSSHQRVVERPNGQVIEDIGVFGPPDQIVADTSDMASSHRARARLRHRGVRHAPVGRMAARATSHGRRRVQHPQSSIATRAGAERVRGEDRTGVWRGCGLC